MNCGVKHKVYGIVAVLKTTCSGKRRAEKVRPEIFKWFCQCLINVLNCNNHVNLLLRNVNTKHQSEVSRCIQTRNSGPLIGKKLLYHSKCINRHLTNSAAVYDHPKYSLILALNHVHKDCTQSTCVHSLECLAF